MNSADPRRLLGVSEDAGDGEIRAAYLRKIKEFPPDRAPREFERIRDAYELLRDPRSRAAQMLFTVDPEAPLTAVLQDRGTERQFTGPEPWLAVAAERLAPADRKH